MTFRLNKPRSPASGSYAPVSIGDAPNYPLPNPRRNHWEDRPPWDRGLGEYNPTLAAVQRTSGAARGVTPQVLGRVDVLTVRYTSKTTEIVVEGNFGDRSPRTPPTLSIAGRWHTGRWAAARATFTIYGRLRLPERHPSYIVAAFRYTTSGGQRRLTNVPYSKLRVLSRSPTKRNPTARTRMLRAGGGVLGACLSFEKKCPDGRCIDKTLTCLPAVRGRGRRRRNPAKVSCPPGTRMSCVPLPPRPGGRGASVPGRRRGPGGVSNPLPTMALSVARRPGVLARISQDECMRRCLVFGTSQRYCEKRCGVRR